MTIITRHLQPRLEEALNAFRVVVVHGARQSGKTTLTRAIISKLGGSYVSLDDEASRSAAMADPMEFLVSYRTPLAIDEVQLGGDRLVRAVKRLVDDDPTPGRFVLTGSTNFLTVPVISESLAGRARILRLDPLSECELNETTTSVTGWFDEVPPAGSSASTSRSTLFEIICRGGYPEVTRMPRSARDGWFESYVETVTQRDIVELADVRNAASLPRLLRWGAGLTSNEFNISNASQTLGIDRATINKYLEWLESVFLIHQVPAWSRNLSGRAVRRSKIHVSDTGLAAHLIGASPTTLASPTSPTTGPLVESFVINEIRRQLTSATARFEMYHYRDNRQREIDLLVERSDGAMLGMEIKATTSPSPGMMRHLEWLRDKLDATSPGAFRAGVLLHGGEQSLVVGDRMHMIPISSLWMPNPPDPSC